MEIAVLKALASEKRLQILEWLKDPVGNFPPQVDGDLIEDGVCGNRIAEKLGVAHPTLTGHMRLLVDTGLVRSRKIRQWVFYKRDEEAIRAIARGISSELQG